MVAGELEASVCGRSKDLHASCTIVYFNILIFNFKVLSVEDEGYAFAFSFVILGNEAP